uniref:Serine/threonine-protein kinase SAK n=1 Tax=Pelusios castaneus TaxID=367368 RepID=A0A8C8SX45_9SAUR
MQLSEERPHSRYLRRAHSSDRSGTSPSQTQAISNTVERCHSMELLSKARLGVMENTESFSSANSYGDIPPIFKDKTSCSSDSFERHTSLPVKDHTRSNYLCPMKPNIGLLEQKSQTETMQQWLGNIQANAQLRKPMDHISTDNANGGFRYHRGVQQETSRNAWNGLKEKKNPSAPFDSAHSINQISTKQCTSGLQCKSDGAKLSSAFGLCPTSEQSKTRSKELSGHQKPTLQSIVSPLHAHRLKPIRQKTKNAVVSILDSGEVCMEFLKELQSQDISIYYKYQLTMITVYHPNEGRGFLLDDGPPSPPEDVMMYSFDNLPEKYWKKYQYAAKFVQLVRSKTPKVTFYTRYAKCMLMENSPVADVEICFYDGAKIHKTAGITRVIEKSGKSYNLKEESEIGLKKEMQVYMDHANEGYSICLALEAAILEEEKRSESVPFFPIIVGRKPGNIESPKALAPSSPLVDVNCTPRDVTSLDRNTPVSSTPTHVPNINPSIFSEGSAITTTVAETTCSSSQQKECSPNSAQLLKSVFVKNVGWASQLTSGAVWVQFNDGSQLVAQAGVSSITYTSPNGQTMRYRENEKLPEYIKEKLHCLSSILVMFTNPAEPR